MNDPYSNRRFLVLGIMLLAAAWAGHSQAQDVKSFTLKEAVDYAIRTNPTTLNAQIDLASAQARIKETIATGLPQVSGTAAFTDNVLIQRVFLPARTFDPTAPEGSIIAVKFGVQYSSNAGVSLSQLLFDGSFLIGLKASKVYQELAVRTLQASKITVAENVTKAYYNVLVTEEQLGLLSANINRLDSLYRETRELNRQGFAEKLDVQRVEVQLNNLKTQLENTISLQLVAGTLLKFQMGYPLTEPLALSEKLAKIDFSTVQVEDVALPFNYASRIEYTTLQSQAALQALNVRNIQSGYYPNARFVANYGYSTGRDKLGQLFTQPWVNAAAIGFNINVPIFDGFGKKYRIAQARNELLKIQNNQHQLEQSINLQIEQSQTMLRNYLKTLQDQKRNLDLSQEILRVTRIKYKEGVGANIEVINAETSFREAQTNYFNALYNALVAKVDLDKSIGRLYVE